MAIDPFDGIRTETPATKIVKSRAEENTLDKDAFLKIFLAQLKAQDPLNPQDSTQLSSQLAQFSQLEQTVLSTQELTKIGDKLDTLIGASGGSARIDPVALIGRQIDFPADELSATPAGSSAPLQIPLPKSPASSGLLVQVEDVASGQRGLLSVTTRRGQAGTFPALPSGDYQLRFENGTPVLAGPAELKNFPIDVTGFQRLHVNEAGEEVIDPDTADPFQFSNGQTYRFTVSAVDANGAGEPTQIDLTRSAAVTSVRIRDGKPVAVADGIEVDPDRIHSIR